MLGYAVIGAGALLIWIAATGKANVFLTALKVQLPTAGAGNTIVQTPDKPGSISSGGGATIGDSGSHMGIDADGNIITIDKPIANMTDEEKDAANAFAHKFPSGI